MLEGDSNCDIIIQTILSTLCDPNKTKTHARHIGIEECINMGLKILRLEEKIEGTDIQDAILSVHHAYMLTFMLSNQIKIIENHNGVAMIILSVPSVLSGNSI
jgi:hypothetical protein